MGASIGCIGSSSYTARRRDGDRRGRRLPTRRRERREPDDDVDEDLDELEDVDEDLDDLEEVDEDEEEEERDALRDERRESESDADTCRSSVTTSGTPGLQAAAGDRWHRIGFLPTGSRIASASAEGAGGSWQHTMSVRSSTASAGQSFLLPAMGLPRRTSCSASNTFRTLSCVSP